VLACAEPPDDVTLVEPLPLDVLLLESSLLVALESSLLVALESSLLVALDSSSSPTELVGAFADELSSLAVVDVDRLASVASRAARPKPAVAAMAVTARPAVTAAARRLPCSRDVMCPPWMAWTEHRGRSWKVAVRAAGATCGSRERRRVNCQKAGSF
jgi:hypothetical protein